MNPHADLIAADSDDDLDLDPRLTRSVALKFRGSIGPEPGPEWSFNEQTGSWDVRSGDFEIWVYPPDAEGEPFTTYSNGDFMQEYPTLREAKRGVLHGHLLFHRTLVDGTFDELLRAVTGSGSDGLGSADPSRYDDAHLERLLAEIDAEGEVAP